MAKQLKLWNGRSPVYHGKFDRGYVYVAAYSQKQAVELINKAMNAYITVSEIRVYYNAGGWGTPMNGIEPTEPCVYATTKEYRAIPERLL